MVHIRLANPVELLHGGQKGEKEPKTSWLLTFVGLAALAGGYFVAVYFKSPLNALLLFFVAVFLVILGTFCLFTAGSIALDVYKRQAVLVVAGLAARLWRSFRTRGK